MGIQIYYIKTKTPIKNKTTNKNKTTIKPPTDSWPSRNGEKLFPMMTEWPGRLFQVGNACFKIFSLYRFILTQGLSGILFYIDTKEFIFNSKSDKQTGAVLYVNNLHVSTLYQ